MVHTFIWFGLLFAALGGLFLFFLGDEVCSGGPMVFCELLFCPFGSASEASRSGL